VGKRDNRSGERRFTGKYADAPRAGSGGKIKNREWGGGGKTREKDVGRKIA
jgi:hypothetical protein